MIEPVARTIWLAAEQPCGKRLAPALPLWLRHYEHHHNRLSTRQRERLREVSAATLDRLLAPARAQQPLRGRCGTKPGTCLRRQGLLKTEIPVRTGTRDVTRPGYLEAGSVAHCGASLAGDFIWSLTCTDIATQWTEGRAVWNKGAAGVLAATRTDGLLLQRAMPALQFAVALRIVRAGRHMARLPEPDELLIP